MTTHLLFRPRLRACISLLAVLALGACSLIELPALPGATEGRPVFKAVSFADLPGFAADDLTAARPALNASCARLNGLPAERSLGAEGRMGKAGDWQPFCRALMATAPDEASLRTLIQARLRPWAVQDGTQAEGLFTGYYEASLRGSLTRHGPYQTPLYARPDDLVMLDLGDFRDEWKGQRLAGRVTQGRLKPYEDRAAIVSGRINARPVVWLDNRIDAFFVQIQGSGRVELDNGQTLRLAYDGQNGHPYTPIGRLLIEQGELSRETVSMHSIRDWLTAHPDRADALMNANPSYVFFKASADKASSHGPAGAANVPLTAGRSLAVDNRYIGYHVPLWLSAEPPQGSAPINRLMVAQDTGGAIRGVVRGDLFWGYGAQAEHQAGLMKSRGRYYVLLPQAIDPR